MCGGSVSEALATKQLSAHARDTLRGKPLSAGGMEGCGLKSLLSDTGGRTCSKETSRTRRVSEVKQNSHLITEEKATLGETTGVQGVNFRYTTSHQSTEDLHM